MTGKSGILLLNFFFHALCLAFICFWFACCVGWGGIVVAGPHNSSGSNNRCLFNWSAPLLCSSLRFLFYLLFLFFWFVSWILSGFFFCFFSFPSSVCGNWNAAILQSDCYIVETYKDFPSFNPFRICEYHKTQFHFFFYVVADSSRNTQQNRGTALAAGFGRVEVFDFKPWQFQSPCVVDCPSLICYRFN